ncbi:MAG: Zn-ribbon domain-containing OB-fold protein [Desulfobacterales bacterium]|nr:Zn-ribbon domain-containing OB-fold protein [Desulfobacterales bacterium]
MEMFKDIEPMVHKSGINVPYTWWAGETAGEFFISLRDEKKIKGKKCSQCGKVYIPPRKTCPLCFIENTEWVEVSIKGTLESYTIVKRQMSALKKKTPVVFGLIKLDGADTSILHYIDEVELSNINIGMRLEAKFSEQRKATIMDIEYFKPLT